jgi:hypothetical protein
MIRASTYPPENPPQESALESAIEQCDLAIAKFGHQFPALHNAQARNLFFALRLDEARIRTRALLASGITLPPTTRHTALLNVAVLSLLLDDFGSAEREFYTFNGETNVATFGEQLVRFADFARDYGFESAVFLQVRYRETLRLSVSADLQQEFARWVINRNVPASLHTIVLS